MAETEFVDLPARTGLKIIQSKTIQLEETVKSLKNAVENLPDVMVSNIGNQIVEKIQTKQISIGRMESDDTRELHKAYGKFLMEIRRSNLEKTGGCGRKNSKGVYISCATLPDLIWFSEELLDKYELTISFMPYYLDKQHLLKTIIEHTPSGQFICGLAPVYVDYDLALSYGKGSSYKTEESKAYTTAKKHAYAAILGVHTGGD